MYGLTREAVATIRRRIRQYAIHCDAIEGGVVLANWFDDDAILRKRQEFMAREYDVHWQFLSHDELGAYTSSQRYAGGLLEPDAFHFHPLKYARGLAAVIERGGGHVFEESRVAKVVAHQSSAGGYDVHTARGVVHARHVVIAGGGYLRGVSAPLERAMLPIATYVMATEPLGDALAQSIPGRAAIYDTRFSFDYYRALPDTRILWGGRIASILDRRRRAYRQRLLKRDMLKVYPELRDVKVDYAWGGLMSYAPPTRCRRSDACPTGRGMRWASAGMASGRPRRRANCSPTRSPRPHRFPPASRAATGCPAYGVRQACSRRRRRTTGPSSRTG